jgi:hypothetical protein
MFKNLPLNTNRTYVMGVADGGCEIYIPVRDGEGHTKKKELKDYLNNKEQS